jgi:N-acyl-D-amino-acid deacylase
LLDILIKNALIVDGLNNPSFVGDVGIKGEYIESVSENIKEKARKIINAKKWVLSPGFIDIHTHSDHTILLNPKAENKLLQGVTTEIGGNCGFSLAPCQGELKNKIYSLCNQVGINLTWNSVDKFLNSIEKNKISINFALLVGSENIKASIIGYRRITPSFQDLKKMEELISISLKEGAFGLSSNFSSSFGSKFRINESLQLAQIVGYFKGFHAIHLRSSGEKIIKAIDEVINLSRVFTRANTHISHLGILGKEYWYKIDSILYKLEKDSEENPIISCDCFPSTGIINKLSLLLPKFIKELPDEEKIKYLYKSSFKRMICGELLRYDPEATFLDNIIIYKVAKKENSWMEGKTLSQISKKLNLKEDNLEFILDILIEEELKTIAIFYLQDQEIIDKIIQKPYTIATSNNSIYHEKSPFIPNFGIYNAFPFFIDKYVNTERILSLEEAIYKITSFPAQRLNIENRGIIKEGMFADIVIFDLNELNTHLSASELKSPSKGIKYVFVNGTLVIDNGVHTEALPGRVLRSNYA